MITLRHESMISCQASPVAERKRTRMASKKVWKLLLRWIWVPSCGAILPNTWIHNRKSELSFILKQLG